MTKEIKSLKDYKKRIMEPVIKEIETEDIWATYQLVNSELVSPNVLAKVAMNLMKAPNTEWGADPQGISGAKKLEKHCESVLQEIVEMKGLNEQTLGEVINEIIELGIKDVNKANYNNLSKRDPLGIASALAYISTGEDFLEVCTYNFYLGEYFHNKVGKNIDKNNLRTRFVKKLKKEYKSSLKSAQTKGYSNYNWTQNTLNLITIYKYIGFEDEFKNITQTKIIKKTEKYLDKDEIIKLNEFSLLPLNEQNQKLMYSGSAAGKKGRVNDCKYIRKFFK